MENKKNNNDYDVLIIGGGPAGLAAALYAKRANVKIAFIEKAAPGGKLVNTYSIENWIGHKFVLGYNLAINFFEHIQHLNIPYLYGEVLDIINHSDHKKELIIKNSPNSSDTISYFTKAVIIATGTTEKIPNEVINIDKFNNFGVHYCAICDGSRYKDQEVAVIGGGQAAFEESLYLSSIAKHVYIFIRHPSRIRADQRVQNEVKNNKKITYYQDSKILELMGNKHLEQIKVRIKDQIKIMDIKAVFPYIGQTPNTSFLKSLNLDNENGFLKVDESMETNIKNIFAIGDVRIKQIRQITTAVADGTIVGKIISSKI